MFRKVLVANRGEIAVRAFRAATELGARTVAVFPYEDRKREHRLKADEAYQIGERGPPVAPTSTRGSSGGRRGRADAIYPGYGFLSENPELAEACAAAGITFIGPPPVLDLTGNKARAIAAAQAGVPDPARRPPITDLDELAAAAEESASRCSSRPSPAAAGAACAASTTLDAAGGARGGPARGRRRLRRPDGLLEQAVVNPRHIEVQMLADSTGTVLHLFERDCSVQRRHQKVVEIAPAPNLDPATREQMCADAVALRRVDRLPQRGHRRVPPRRGRPLRLHRDEPADPGRAHRHRGGDRRRPRRRPDPDRRR